MSVSALPDRPARPSLWSIAAVFAAISSTSFGGGQKASIRQQVVKHGWIDADGFLEGLELAQVLPGPNILNLAIFCGQRARGVPGAIAAFFGASIPPLAIVLVAGALYFKFANDPLVRGGLRGCAVGALGLTVANALELSWDERTDWVKLLLLAITAVVVALFKMPLLLVLTVLGGTGILHEYLRSRKKTAAP